MTAYYGNPDAGHGTPDLEWEVAEQGAIPDGAGLESPDRAQDHPCPPEGPRQPAAVLEAIAAHYGSQAAIERARLHLFGGLLLSRKKADVMHLQAAKMGQKPASANAGAAKAGGGANRLTPPLGARRPRDHRTPR
jgi:hypothetical protein